MTPTSTRILALLNQLADGQTGPAQVLAEWPDDAPSDWSMSWFKTVMMRPRPPAKRSVLMLHSALEGEPRRRTGLELARRTIALSACSAAADALTGQEIDAFHAAIEHPLLLDDGFDWLDHPEVCLVMAAAEGAPLSRGMIVQLSWRNHSAGALAWVLGWTDDVYIEREALAALLPTSVTALTDMLATGTMRSVEEIEAMIGKIRGDLTPDGPPSAEHGRALEVVKALRFSLDSRWSELAVTPWQEEGSGLENVSTAEEFGELRKAALRQLMGA